MLQYRCVFLPVGDVQRDAEKARGCSVFEVGLAAGRNPALDAIADPADTVFDVIGPVASGVGTFGDRRLDTRPVLRMDTGDEHLVIDMGFRRQAPHRFQPGIPVENIGLRIPGIAAQTDKLDCRLESCLAFAQTLLRDPAGNHVAALVGVEVGQSQFAIGRSARTAKMRGQHADRLAAAAVNQRRRLHRAKPCRCSDVPMRLKVCVEIDVFEDYARLLVEGLAAC